MSSVINRFLRYVKVDTQSDPKSTTFPSVISKEIPFADSLTEELKAIGITDAARDEYGYVFGTIPSTIENYNGPVIGLIAHMDTAQEASGANVNPQFITNYDGGDIVLNESLGMVMRPADFESLHEQVGKTLITTDGTTLLGGDDKAGLAEIMAMAEYLMQHPEIKHGPVRVGFTPDEEIGSGVDYFDVKRFGADYAYTMDGGALGELEYENFNAAGAVVKVKGLAIHPGSSKNKMKSAIEIAIEFQNLLPAAEKPMFTERYEGFTHLLSLNGTVAEAEAEYIIRDHDMTLFNKKKAFLQTAADLLNAKYGEGTVSVEVADSYYNMKEQIEPHMFLIDNLVEIYKELDIPVRIQPIRGGTDGARLSFMGLPCPNLGTGDYNCHGPFEYVVANDMEKAVEMLVKLVQRFAE